MDVGQNKEEMVVRFCEITGGTRQNCFFFLESSNWNLELALASYYENFSRGDNQRIGGAEEPVMFTGIEEVSDAGRSEEDMITNQMNASEPGHRRDLTAHTIPSASSAPSRIATIANILQNQDSSSDEDEGQAYYAGGSEHSGQQIVGPPRSSNDIITDLFRSVRSRGGVEEVGTSSRFGGQGYRLGQSTNDTQVILSGTSNLREVVLRLWRNGFTVDNGTLRSYSDPVDKDFLERIQQGHIPSELYSQVEDGSVNLSLEDRRNENWSVDDNKATPFAGEGHILGSGRSEVVRINPGAISGDCDKTINVDQGQPTSTIQVRLPDGDRLRISLNHTHTIRDLRAAIIQQRPIYRQQGFVIMTSFPRVELNNDSLTLVEADILTSSILLRPQ